MDLVAELLDPELPVVMDDSVQHLELARPQAVLVTQLAFQRAHRFGVLGQDVVPGPDHELLVHDAEVTT
jgi:hypothetical protein